MMMIIIILRRRRRRRRKKRRGTKMLIFTSAQFAVQVVVVAAVEVVTVTGSVALLGDCPEVKSVKTSCNGWQRLHTVLTANSLNITWHPSTKKEWQFNLYIVHVYYMCYVPSLIPEIPVSHSWRRFSLYSVYTCSITSFPQRGPVRE